ncbi:AAA-ATPase At3g28580-like isoform X1 [Rhododendron vialii]|uniref:AAA-ATPase At3g28580-like isoform X1 n=1 Tax=Rhododendron vialii TaxID=182163 RepID=UPI00265DCC5C|nr:AAA-ATPase At3g28580-like isoform X1 [Rhododendron vialii]
MVNPLPFMGHQGQGSPGHEGMSQMGLGMAIAASMVVLTMFQQFLFSHFGGYLERCLRKLVSSMDPYVQIRFTEDSTDGGGPKNYEAYAAIETYLSSKCSAQAPRLKANSVRDINAPVLCVDDGEGVSDEFNGVTVWWHLGREKDQGDIYRGSRRNRNRYYALTFRKKNREIVVGEYVRHVMEEGKAVAASHRQLKLYSNSSSEHGAYWNYIMDFDHPAKFETLAMEKEKKEEIIDDLIRFSTGREYYKRIGKPWKRGYLLYGPPGTGKSTMIAAMANLLSYDVYDLELTAVLSNAALKRLLNRIPCNSILVIEDIDCSSKITNQREMTNQDEEKTVKILEKVTLSGLLNCIDGLFSANDGGRLMVFTTNNVEALDSALVRRGRMDKHIQMTYCGFEAFRILAKNYLRIEEHELFGRIEELLKESSVTPADVAETLIERRGKAEDCGREYYLNKLIRVLEENCETKKSINREMLEKKGKGELENGECK